MIDKIYTDEGLKERLTEYLNKPAEYLVHADKTVLEILLVTAVIRLDDRKISKDSYDGSRMYNILTDIVNKSKSNNTDYDIDYIVRKLAELVESYANLYNFRESVKKQDIGDIVKDISDKIKEKSNE